MKKALIPLMLALLLTGCALQPAWLAPSAAPLRTPVPAQAVATPEPANFDAMAYADLLLGGGHQTEGTTLTLGRDVVITAPLYLANYRELVIDLNGHAIRYEASAQQTENKWKDSIFVLDESRVTLCSTRPGGAIECAAQSALTGITVMNHAALTVDGVDIILTNGLAETSCAIYATGGAYAEIDGGSFVADCAVFADDPTQEGTTVVLNGGSFGAAEALCGLYVKDTITAVVNGGVYRGSLGGMYAEGKPYVTVYTGDFDKIADAAQSGWMPELGGGAVWETTDAGIVAR